MTQEQIDAIMANTFINLTTNNIIDLIDSKLKNLDSNNIDIFNVLNSLKQDIIRQSQESMIDTKEETKKVDDIYQGELLKIFDSQKKYGYCFKANYFGNNLIDVEGIIINLEEYRTEEIDKYDIESFYEFFQNPNNLLEDNLKSNITYYKNKDLLNANFEYVIEKIKEVNETKKRLQKEEEEEENIL